MLVLELEESPVLGRPASRPVLGALGLGLAGSGGHDAGLSQDATKPRTPDFHAMSAKFA